MLVSFTVIMLLVLTRNLYAWHLFYIPYETMYNVIVPAQ